MSVEISLKVAILLLSFILSFIGLQSIKHRNVVFKLPKPVISKNGEKYKPLSVRTNVVGLQTDDISHLSQNSSAHVVRVVGLQTDAVVITKTRYILLVKLTSKDYFIKGRHIFKGDLF